MPTTDTHSTFISQNPPETGPAWQAHCFSCGLVGSRQDYEADARAIADRHRDNGGFER